MANTIKDIPVYSGGDPVTDFTVLVDKTSLPAEGSTFRASASFFKGDKGDTGDQGNRGAAEAMPITKSTNLSSYIAAGNFSVTPNDGFGAYANAGGLSVTEDELENYDVRFNYIDGVWSKSLTESLNTSIARQISFENTYNVVEGWANGFYNILTSNVSAAFVNSADYRYIRLNDVTIQDRFFVSGGFDGVTSSVSVAIAIFYDVDGNKISHLEQGISPGPPKFFVDLPVIPPAGTKIVVFASDKDVDFSLKRNTGESITDRFGTVETSLNDTQAAVQGLTDEVNNLKIAYPPRLNASEGTTNPQYFKTNTETTNIVKVTIEADTTSIFKDYLPFKRVFNNTMLAVPGTKYLLDQINAGTQSNRPTFFSVSYWMKEADIRAIWASTMQVYFGLFSFDYNIINLLNNVGTTQVVNGAPPSIAEYSTARLTVKVAKIESGLAQIVQEWDNIIWKPGWAGTSIAYYFQFSNRTPFYNLPVDIYNLTFLHSRVDTDVLMYSDPGGLFTQKPELETPISMAFENVENRVSELETGLQNILSAVRFQIIGTEIYIASPFSDTQDLVRRINVFRPLSTTTNQNANIVETRLIAKDAATLTGGTLQKSSEDDICPIRFGNNAYIGGNHGWPVTRNLNLSGHGKTVADVGARYQDANSVMFTIVRFIDANNLIICSDNQAVDGFGLTFPAPSGTLTYIGNGSNTGNISGYTTSPVGNLYNSAKSLYRKILVDGKKEVTTTDAIRFCEFIDIAESYDIVDITSALDNIRTGRPGGGYPSNPNLTDINADPLFNYTVTYRFLSNGTTLIIFNMFAYKKMPFAWNGVVQSIAMTGTNYLYIPKLLPISDGVKTWDFRKIENWTTAPAAELNFMPSTWEVADSPPDRIINYNASVMLHLGYLFDRGLGLKRKTESLNSAGFLAVSRKLYPRAISTNVPIEANESQSCVAFRQWTNTSTNPAGRIAFNWFVLNNKGYVFLDYSASIIDYVDMPEDLQGRTITVVEKSSNVIIMSEVATNKLPVKVTIDGVNTYGYAVLVLE